ncbi:hypothetical protein BUALT_Bualt01G0124000 [Buddleja alternifolia]|uniref:Myb/SANT-like domain-containing protein n=1 Tax=Buddleja alternifolia TaxID=168488 RepID=A0AAV6YF44_9LAMI|nr:hypothetical protein BUALT_Bualt01G0124000 [Buddleja alternifolia]
MCNDYLLGMELPSSRQTKGQEKKIDKRRRCWLTKEEEVLIVALKDIIYKGWKCETGFRTGYLRLLEKAMVKAFPRTDIRAEPHINSKIHVWKKSYGSLTSMFGVSGISWNNSTKMIDAQDDAWDLYVKTDSNARTMRYKSWPYYPDWCEIFGKDRAPRENAEDYVDAVQEMEANKGDAVQEMETNKRKEKEAAAEFGCCVFEGVDSENEMSVCQPQSNGTEKKQAPKKRKMSSSSDCNSDPFVEAINVFCDKLDARFDDIAKRIGFEYDVSNARKEVYGALGRIPGLLVREKLTVAKFLVNKTADLDLFFSLPDKDRAEMVNMILAGQY